MRIVVYAGRHEPPDEGPYPYVLLYQDNWDDFGYRCRFVAELRLSDEHHVELGGVRIAVGRRGFRAAGMPATLERLPRGAASMGESVAYYSKLRYEVPERIRTRYLRLMRDLVANPSRREGLEDAPVWENSFMREASSRHALKRAGYYVGQPTEDVEPPAFEFSVRLAGAASRHSISVDFGAYPDLPNRLMLLVGRNGTGKTKVLAGLVSALVADGTLQEATVVRRTRIDPVPEFSRVIAISYNAFDEFPRPRRDDDGPRPVGLTRKSRHSYKYCGLRGEGGAITTGEIATMLDDALGPVAESSREHVLRRVLARLLGEDFALRLTDDAQREQALRALSAGQRLVAAIFANVVGFVEEGSLLLIDEPETHLHPGLLSSVAAALQDVLAEFDSYAIVATHSPILLQQVPSPYVRVFGRRDDAPEIAPLAVESFGEDLGELNRMVLGLADPERDFTSTLDVLLKRHGSSDAVERLFPHGLGVQAMAHLYGSEDEADDL